MKNKNEYLRQCRYYKGEKDNPFKPFDQPKNDFWKVEKWWFEDTMNIANGNAPVNPMANCLELFLSDPIVEDRYLFIDKDVPRTITASLFQWWIHKNERPKWSDFVTYMNIWIGV